MKIKNSLGLSFDFLANGSVKSIEVDPIRISLQAKTPFSRSGANLYLRNRLNPLEFTALLGPESHSRFNVNEASFLAEGSWAGIDYKCVLQLSQKSLSWQWCVELINTSAHSAELDLICVQDAGLRQISDAMVNEYYVSQYIERRILGDKRFGPVLCCRQNMKESVGNPWMMMACKNGAAAASVDGMQFYGKTFRGTGIAEGLHAEWLGGEYSGESSVVALQEEPFSLAAGHGHKTVFLANFLPDHPQATTEDDLVRLPALMDEFGEDVPFQDSGELFDLTKNVFTTSAFLPVDELTDAELTMFFGTGRRHREEEKGQLLSFFCGQNNHVILGAKEKIVDRPHAHIMQAKTGYTPDEAIVSTASFAYGAFNSHLTQGNTNFNILFSVCSSQFNLHPETGQRIFVGIGGTRYLLGIPSAFEIGLNHCRWIYKFGEHCFQVRTWTSPSSPAVNMDFRVVEGNSVALLVTHHFDAGSGWKINPGSAPGEYVATPREGSMIAGKFPKAQYRLLVNGVTSGHKACGDEALYPDRVGRGDNFFILEVPETTDFCIRFVGEVDSSVKTVDMEDADRQWLSDYRESQSRWEELCLHLSLKGDRPEIAAIQEILPWYGMNALTHFLTPYGLEQFSGAAWGTRDVAQGPFDLLLGMEKYDEARQVLRIIFSHQNADGGWPQWWMFDRYADIRADSSHGDVFYWCMIALSNYIKVTGDMQFLGEVLPYYNEPGRGPAEQTPVSEHIDRLIDMIVHSFIPGTALVPFGGGDWNDSLQPLDGEMAKRMISSWTVEMNYQAFSQYGEVFGMAGNEIESRELQEICSKIKADFNNYLVRDGVVAGYGLVGEDGSISLLLHPGDKLTNIRYSILPMNRGVISGIFTSEQARHHQELIELHLKGPDGARLMDRPLTYKGGIQTLFQRAETSTFFGREIGIMYMHEHIRYAESQALTGRADAFLKALLQAIPVAYRDIVPCGDVRQSNCYYSSSDVIFKNRYEADRHYDEIKTGKITLRGGWRVYSSGPGIYIGLIVTRLLGLRKESGNIIVDPVIPHSLDGMSASLDVMGRPVTFIYSVSEDSFGPKSIFINDKPVMFTQEGNQYRQGGAVIPASRFLAMLDQEENVVRVQL